MRAERLTGYFWTSASKRAASSGEKTDMDSGFFFLGLIAVDSVVRSRISSRAQASAARSMSSSPSGATQLAVIR